MSAHLLKYFQLQSSMAEISWPPMPAPMSAQLLTLLNYLEYSQWLPTEELLNLQFQQLAQVVTHAQKTVPYYQDCLSQFKHLDHAQSLNELWSDLPILTRQDLQNIGSNLYSNASPPTHGEPVKQTSSGSTGTPITVLANEATQFFWCLFTLRDHIWHQRNLQASLAHIHFTTDQDAQPPQGKISANWGMATYMVTATGPCYELSYCPVAQQAEWLQRIKPNYLLSNPSNIKALFHYMCDNNIDINYLQEVRTYSEIIEPSIRKLIQEKLAIPLIDMYSAKEIGYIALQCPQHEHYHIQAENVFVEILNEAQKPCQPGEIGKVVITALHNFSSPLIRYHIGDYAEVGEPCDCGRGLPVLKRILGRQRNMLILPNGQQFWPIINGTNIVLIEMLKNCQFQIIQKSIDTIEIKLVRLNKFNSIEEEQLRALIQKALTYPFNILINYVNEIPREASGKFEDFKSEVAIQL